MKQPKISVIIPVYNAEQYLQDCLASVVNQTLKEIEIICVDDGSTDKSLEYLREYQEKDSRIKILQQSNQGAGIARNTGLACATGEYIHFLDADDYLDAKAYETFYQAAVQFNVDLVKSKARGIDSQTGEWVRSRLYDLVAIREHEFNRVMCFTDMPEKFAKNISVVPWNGLYRANFLKQHEMKFNHLKCVNDRSFYNNVILHAHRIVLIPEVTVYHRKNIATSLVGQRIKHFECHFESYRIIEQQCAGQPDKLKALILNEEISDMSGWYRQYRSHKTYGKEISQKMKAFLKTIDLDFFTSKGLSPSWLDIAEELGVQKKKRMNCLLRKIHGGIRCYQENGISYTLQRGKKKLLARFGKR